MVDGTSTPVRALGSEWPDSSIVPGGHAQTTAQSDAQRTLAIASLAVGLTPAGLMEALRSEYGALRTVSAPGIPKRLRFWPVTDADALAFPGRFNGGCVGQIKKIGSWEAGAQIGDPVHITDFRYSYAAFPHAVSHIEESVVSLTQDLIDQFN